MACFASFMFFLFVFLGLIIFIMKKINNPTIVCQTSSHPKLPPGGSYLFMKYDVFRQYAGFLSKECSIFNFRPLSDSCYGPSMGF